MPLLFSYGSLQQEDVQIATFGRRLSGTPDELLGYEISMQAIADPKVVESSGKTQHPIVKYNGSAAARVPGMLFEISERELGQADRYEVAAYKRVSALLRSGQRAWVYVDARLGDAVFAS